MTNIKKFPITTSKRIKNKRGNMSVSCALTDRWLVFDKESYQMQEGEVFFINVMTDAGEKPRKICHLAIAKEDILKVLNQIEPRE